MTARVYLLMHSRGSGNSVDTKVLGVYSLQVRAEAATAELRTQPGFREEPLGFSSFEIELDIYRGDDYERVLLSD